MQTDYTMPVSAKKGSGLAWGMFALALAGGVGAAAFLFKQADAERVQAQAKLSKAEKELGDAIQRVAALELQRDELAQTRAELAQEVKAKDSELAQLRNTFDTLKEKMQQEIHKGEISLSQVGGKIRVDLVDKILFDSGDASLSTRGMEVLTRVGAVLAEVKDKQIQVSGHTDDIPMSDKLVEKFPTNWELSSARAINVVRFLSEKAGVPPLRLAAAGYAEYHPIATNGTTNGRARNRRIEILLTPAIDPKPIPGTKAAALAKQESAKPKVEAKPEPATKAKAEAKVEPAKSKAESRAESGKGKGEGKPAARKSVAKK